MIAEFLLPIRACTIAVITNCVNTSASGMTHFNLIPPSRGTTGLMTECLKVIKTCDYIVDICGGSSPSTTKISEALSQLVTRERILCGSISLGYTDGIWYLRLIPSYSWADVRPRDSRLGKPGPGMTSCAATSGVAAAAA